MATHPQTGLTYDDLAAFPEDNLRRELIDGELIVTAAPATRHQRAVAFLTATLWTYQEEHGGVVLPAPTDVLFSDIDVVEPDVLFVTALHLNRVEARLVRGAPDLVIEISSPTTRRLELVRKRDLYERYMVPEYWYVDLDAERVEIHRLKGDRYDKPAILMRGDVVESEVLPGFAVEVDYLLGPAGD